MEKFKCNNQIVTVRISSKAWDFELREYFGFANPVRIDKIDPNKLFYQLLNKGYLMNLSYC